MPRIIAISDTHNRHDKLTIPEGDILLHAGDISQKGSEREVLDFINWFAAQPHPHKIFIAGNHDHFVEKAPYDFRQLLPDTVTYLENESTEVMGLKIWGSPVTPWFGGMAFNMRRGEEIAAVWEQMPNDTDIVLVHGPPKGIKDRALRIMSVGCEDLAQRLTEVNPKLCIFGHVHEDHGQVQVNGTLYANVTSLNLLKQARTGATIFDL